MTVNILNATCFGEQERNDNPMMSNRLLKYTYVLLNNIELYNGTILYFSDSDIMNNYSLSRN